MTKWKHHITKAETCRLLGYVPSTAARWGMKPPQHVRVFLELHKAHGELVTAHAAMKASYEVICDVVQEGEKE